MQWLAAVCVKRPTFAAVLMLIITVLGLTSYSSLGVDEFPNVDIPIVIVTTRLDGAAPEEVEREVTDKIEGAVNTIGGVEELRSTSSEGVSMVIIQFTLDRDVDVAAQDVRGKIDQIRFDLPRGIESPTVTKVDPGAVPVLLVAIRSDKDVRETTEIADKLVRRRLESVDGVGQVMLVGGKKRQIHVWLDPLALRAAGLTPAAVQAALATQNATAPGGSVEAGPDSISVRIEGRAADVDSIRRIVVAETDGRPIRVEDVARVEDGAEEERSFAQIDDERTVVLSIQKQSGKNTVAVVDALKERVAEIQGELPEGVRLEVLRDNSSMIRTGLDAVTEHLVVGAILAALVVLLFLGNARSTIIAAVAIPISIIGTFAMMKLAGFTLNFLTLLALALAVGIVIDDAIVVLENITRYIEEKRQKPFTAAVLATREIGLAVLATTLSLVAVFVPVAFAAGMIGRFLGSFGLTMAFAIMVSMVVSFSLTPSLSARWLKPAAEGHEKKPLLARAVDVFYRPIERAYMVVLRFSMKHRWVVIIASLGALAASGPLGSTLPSGFVPPDDRGQFEISIRAPEGTSAAETRLIAERIALDVSAIPSVVRTMTTVADDLQQTGNAAKVFVFLTDPKTRVATQRELMDRVRTEVLPRHPSELSITLGEVQGISTGAANANVMYSITGPDLDVLAEKATRITEELKKVPGAVDVQSSLVTGKPALAVSIDRERAADQGVRMNDVATAMQLFVGGVKATTYSEAGEQYDVRLRADARFRADEEGLSLLSVPSMKHGAVPLASLVSLEATEGPSKIERLGRRRQVTILANAAPGYGDSAIQEAFQAILKKEGLPPGYDVKPAGMTKEAERMGKSFLLVTALAFVFMYLVLAAQFESWLHPVTILLALPLTVPFALLSLHLFGQTLNLFSGLGMLVLFGVVKKNAILQIDHTNHLRSLGKPRLQAILEANRDRLRPILMTTLAFVAGMVPLLLSRGIGSGLNQAIAGIVVGGQTFSLLLTLLAVPVVYSLFDDVIVFFRRFHGEKVDRGEAELKTLLGEEHAPAAEE
ncbi:MAG: efflux RND transporter permease subunit [Polyangiaceae bacterium]|nr:efflux RND transporter permease subunit [Polyangiaceae bacterium]MBK8942666.1 efflux RND transporter permease subunit [Polyangiaceae bacterium]